MNTQKGFASILIILLGLVVIGGGVYVFDQKKDLGIFGAKENMESIMVIEEKKEEIKETVPKDVKETKSEKQEDKASFNSQEEQTKSRIELTGSYDYTKDKGIFFTLEKEYPGAEKYKLPIKISGYVSDSTKWRVFEGEAGLAELYGVEGGLEKKIATAPITLKDFSYDKKPPFYFDFFISDREWISNLEKEEGYIILKEAGAKDGDVIDSIKISILFDIQS